MAHIAKEGGQVTALLQLLPLNNFRKKKKKECLPLSAFILVLKVMALERERKETEVRQASREWLQKIYKQMP